MKLDLNPKPQTPNPKPQTPNLRHGLPLTHDQTLALLHLTLHQPRQQRSHAGKVARHRRGRAGATQRQGREGKCNKRQQRVPAGLESVMCNVGAFWSTPHARAHAEWRARAGTIGDGDAAAAVMRQQQLGANEGASAHARARAVDEARAARPPVLLNKGREFKCRQGQRAQGRVIYATQRGAGALTMQNAHSGAPALRRKAATSDWFPSMANLRGVSP